MPWQTPETKPTAQSAYALFDNQFSYIRVDNFLTPDECARLIAGIKKVGLAKYDYAFDETLAPKARHLFDSHYLYEQRSPEIYFPKANESLAEYRAFCADAGIDPALRVRDFLSKLLGTPVSIAEQAGQQYTYALVRELASSAMIHADFAQFIPSYWSISDTIAECAWNLYLTDPEQGGACVVYNKPWELSDDKHIIDGTYGYNPQVVAGREFVEIPVKAGQFVLFNCRNFHEVRSSSKMRLSIGGHVGMNAQKNFVMWV